MCPHLASSLERFHGVGAAYEILVLRTPVRFWVEPFFIEERSQVKGGVRREEEKNEAGDRECEGKRGSVESRVKSEECREWRVESRVK